MANELDRIACGWLKPLHDAWERDAGNGADRPDLWAWGEEGCPFGGLHMDKGVQVDTQALYGSALIVGPCERGHNHGRRG